MKQTLNHAMTNPRLHVRRQARLFWRQGLGLVAAVGLMGATAGAQATSQAASQAGGMSTQSPFWGGSPAAAHPGANPGYGGGYHQDDFDDSFPVSLVGEVAPAHANYTAMKWGYRTTRSAVWLRVTELRNDFEASEEYGDLQRQINDALAALEQARQEAYAPLREDPEYVAVGRLHQSLQDQIRRMHREQGSDSAEITAMSEQAMEYAQRQRDMELALAGTDNGIVDARKRLEELGERQREMESEFERSVRDDGQLRQMRAEMNQLKIAKLATGAYYESAVRAANVATSFAYTRQYLRSPWYGRAGYVSPYGYGGYGYGGYSSGGFIIAGPGAGGLGPRQIKLGNTFPPMFGTGVPFVGTGAQVNSAPTLPPEAFE